MQYIVGCISPSGEKYDRVFHDWRSFYDWCVDTGHRHDGWRAFPSGTREATFYGLKGPSMDGENLVYEQIT
jgi:hypothetical protein